MHKTCAFCVYRCMCIYIQLYDFLHALCILTICVVSYCVNLVLISAVKLDKKKQRNKEISLALQHAAAHSSGGHY